MGLNSNGKVFAPHLSNIRKQSKLQELKNKFMADPFFKSN